MPLLVREPKTETELEKIIALRYEILRRRWDQPYDTSSDGLEEQSINAFIEDEKNNVIACGRLQKNDVQTAQVRYMAVSPERRGQGLGASILSYLEDRARDWQVERIQLQARENALDFYKSHGYVVVEKTFLLWGQVQHYLMQKTL